MRTDPERAALADATGVYVRAQRPDDRWDSVDMAELDRESLIEFVKSRGPVTDWARDLVLILLHHSRDGLDYVKCGAVNPRTGWVCDDPSHPDGMKHRTRIGNEIYDWTTQP